MKNEHQPSESQGIFNDIIQNKIISKISPNHMTPVNLYLFLSLSGILLFFLILPFKGVGLFDWVVMENNPIWGTLDYYRHVWHSGYRETIYAQGPDVTFPPLAYIFYYYICRSTSVPYSAVELVQMPYLPYQTLVYVSTTLLGVLWIAYVIDELKLSKLYRILVTFSLLFSVPMFAGAIERGNNVLFVLAIMLNVLIWKDSDKAWKRECAMLLIAIAAGLKVYPAVMGIFYLKERRFREAGRLIIYGIIFFFGPFVFFGGFEGMKLFLEILMDTMGYQYELRIQFLKGMVTFFGIRGGAADILNTVFMAALLAGMFFTRSRIREMTYFAAFMALVPGGAFRYTLSFFFLPVYVMLQNGTETTYNIYGKSGGQLTLTDTIPHLFFTAGALGCLFSIPTLFGILTHFAMNYDIYSLTYVERYVYTLIWVYLAMEFLMDIWQLVERFKSSGS